MLNKHGIYQFMIADLALAIESSKEKKERNSEDRNGESMLHSFATDGQLLH